MEKHLQQMEAALWQGLIFQAAIAAIASIAMLYALYLVVKAAVRDGVREGLAQSRSSNRREPANPTSSELPDMRAD